MKISKILLFMASVLLGLVAICIFMPEEGVEMGTVKLEFPSLHQVFGAEETNAEEEENPEQQLSPEELLERRMSLLQAAHEDEFRQFVETSPARIYLPGGEETYLDAFFKALEQADSMPMRILHLGDSQLECDRVSCSLREHYQEEFGGHGVGLVPALQTVATYTTSQSISSEEVGHYLAYGPADARAPHNRYGVMAQVNHVPAGTTISLSARDVRGYPHTASFNRITVMAHGSGGMSVHGRSVSRQLTAVRENESLTRYTAVLPEGVNSLSISINGDYDIYGIQLDDTIGVSLDNVPMRGCSGTIFTRIDESSMKPYFEKENVRLVILQYGGNSVPGTTKASNISTYMDVLRKQIRLFKRLAPESSFLFIGPADMATRIHGEMQTYEILPQMVDSLREMSLQEGIAFWDMYAAMGGKGSIVKWNQASPQLAGGDFVHFTPKGAQKMADMLYGTLQMYYRFYRLRSGQEREALLQEIEENDSLKVSTTE